MLASVEDRWCLVAIGGGFRIRARGIRGWHDMT